MASSNLSDEDFLESLGISLDDVDLTADADTHASVTGIFAQDPHIKLDVGESSITEIPIEIFDHNNPVGAIIRPSYLGYLRHFDMGRNSHKELLGALAERCIPYYPPDGPPALREVSLESVDRPALPSENITEVPVGLVNQMTELILRMQQELTSCWTHRAFDDQRRTRPRRC
ncbi:hypothetical protein JCGZ_24406 [Jatropha curcas]|uniref:Uncharacterized protein n=1 Tax=Jatropha curcas TaxID=180498 RepID=A0A067JM64_JATCU|nr:hypothetical protein JCGZ_24406 [Jatropha curcas]